MTEILAGGWTLERLRAKTPEDRYVLWLNARRKGTEEALALAQFIERCGLEFAEKGGISMTDPRVIEMRDVIESPEGRAACLEATSRGEPALAGVEPLIVARMGDRYGPFSMMTVTAGAIVGELMLSHGFTQGRQSKMPPGSVAKTATVWRRTGR